MRLAVRMHKQMALDKVTKENQKMSTQRLVRLAAGVLLTLGAITLLARLNISPAVQAQDYENDNEDKLVHIGYQIAPVPLNLEGKDSEQRYLVGLGSYIVNAQADCNGCHTAGGPPNFNYANNGNPYFLNPPLGTKTDPTTYLAGGSPFGQAVPSSASVGGFPPGSIPPSYPPDGYPIDPTTGFPYAGPVIISRNLTPDKYGRPEGGRTLEEFKEILRTGKDFDNIHPTCLSDADPNIATGVCVPPPVDGSKLQVMPWPLLHNMTDHQIEAIYEYLSAIPCIDNNFSTPPAGAPNELRNDCGTDVPAVSQGHAAGTLHRGRRQ
jgi:hypothetical protein